MDLESHNCKDLRLYDYNYIININHNLKSKLQSETQSPNSNLLEAIGLPTLGLYSLKSPLLALK